MGLDPWEDDPEGVLVRIFDRWGNRVYENENYATPSRGTAMAARKACTSTPSCCPTEKSSPAR